MFLENKLQKSAKTTNTKRPERPKRKTWLGLQLLRVSAHHCLALEDNILLFGTLQAEGCEFSNFRIRKRGNLETK